jgi:hypothetical protein
MSQTTTQVDQYLLGYRRAEQERLQSQAQMLAGDALLDLAKGV